MNITQLLEERANVRAEQVVITDTAEAEKRELTAEDRQKWDACDKRIDELTEQIEIAEKDSKRSKQFDTAPTETPEVPAHRSEDPTPEAEYREAFTRYLAGGMADLSPDQRKVLATGRVDDSEVRAQAVGTGSAGGYMVPPGFRADLIKRMKQFGNVQGVAQVIETETGNNLQWPTMDDTSNVGALLAENTQMAEQDVALGTASLDAYLYYSKLTRISLQLVQDAAFDVEQTVIDAHGERIGRILNQHLTTGTGSSQPNGIVTGATSGVTAAGVAAVTADELIDLVHSVDPAYRNSPRARFMTTDTALKAIRKLKDTTNQYLWQPGLTAGQPDSILGYPIEINQDMAVPATGVKSWLFGDFYAGYIVRIVRGIQVVTFSERYLDYLQVAHASYMRADGEVQNANAYKALTQA